MSGERKAAGPFDALLGHRIHRIPKTTSMTRVVDGQRLDDKARVPEIADSLTFSEDSARVERKRLRRELDRVYFAERYQRERQDPKAMARRKAWADAHREERLAYLREYRKRNRERMREQKADWARRNYRSDPESAKAKSKAWYAAHREEILAKKAQQRAEAKAAKQAAAGAANTPSQPPKKGT